jgi:hypothetical protein
VIVDEVHIAGLPSSKRKITRQFRLTTTDQKPLRSPVMACRPKPGASISLGPAEASNLARMRSTFSTKSARIPAAIAALEETPQTAVPEIPDHATDPYVN